MADIIKEFILTGKLGFLEIGMHRFDVQQQIPKLWEGLMRKSKGSSDFWIGNLQMHFRRPYLTSIRIDFSGEITTLPSVIYGPEVIENFPKRYKGFISYLKQENISFEKVFDEDGVIELSMGGGVFAKILYGQLMHIRRNPVEAEAIKIEEMAQATYAPKAKSETKT